MNAWPMLERCWGNGTVLITIGYTEANESIVYVSSHPAYPIWTVEHDDGRYRGPIVLVGVKVC